jgi:hypothetical protein
VKRLFETAVLLVVSAPAVMWAQSLTVQQDSFYAPGSASNYGTLPTIDVGGATQFCGLVQFDLSVLPNGTAGAQVSRATLSLFVDKVGAPGVVNIDVANYPWTEIAVNGINPPAAGAAILDGISIGTASAGSYLTVDVTQAVKNWLDHLAQNNGFLISPGNPAVSVFFDSKENTSTSHPASLSITLVGPAGPTGPTGATGAQGPPGTGSNVLPAGSAGAPSLSFVGNSNTGLFSAAANTVNIATNGTSRLQVGPTGDLDFFGNLTQTGILLARVAGSTTDLSTSFGIGNLGSGAGSRNTAIGAEVMTSNATGHDNTALGAQALTHLKTGLHNTALGSTALTSAIGNDNVAIGFGAGSNLNVGDQNIYIANTGPGNESGAIRIGTAGAQNAAFIAGVRGITPAAGNGLPVVIDSNGQLGTVNSITGPVGPQGPQGSQGPVGPAGPSSLAGMFTSVRIDANLNGGSGLGSVGYGSIDAYCPFDHPILVSGGCGHRDNNNAQTDLTVNYTGPDPNGGQFWHCLMTVGATSSRAVVAYAICSK